MEALTYLNEEDVKKLLNWDTLIPAMEIALADISKNDNSVIQPNRLFLGLPSKNGALLTMPGYSAREDSLGCKLVTSFSGNKALGIPSILATILMFDSNTGKLKAVLEGTEITAWRTAGASVVATKHFHKGEKNVLAILGAGAQGKSHAKALQHTFNFKQVRIWNRTAERADKLVSELGGGVYKAFRNKEDCVKGADVICTTTASPEPIVHWSWLSPGAHINAIGSSILSHHSELDEETYRKGIVVVDSIDAAEKELGGLMKSLGIQFWGEVGELVNRTKPAPPNNIITIFHSLGLAIEDVLAANTVYKAYKKKPFN